jgi:hypothetical protein
LRVTLMPFTYLIESSGTIVRIIGADKGSLEAARDTCAIRT